MVLFCSSDPWWDGSTSAKSHFLCTPPGQPAAFLGGTQLTYTYASPQILSVVPNHGPTVGGITLSVTGNSFGLFTPLPTFAIGPNNCIIKPSSIKPHHSFNCTLPAGEGNAVPSILTVATLTSNTFLFRYDAPVINSIFPTKANTSGLVLLTINGKNFGVTVGTITVGGTNCPVNPAGPPFGTWADTVITCQLQPGTGVNWPVIVTAFTQSSNNNILFSYLPPSITSVRFRANT